MTRREFVGAGAAFAAVTPSFAAKPSEMSAVFLHMGMNMWGAFIAEIGVMAFCWLVLLSFTRGKFT